MMTLEIFKERLAVIQRFDSELDDRIEDFMSKNPLIEDGSGVRSSFMSDAILDHIITLFYATAKNPQLTEFNIKQLAEYYLYEGNYGGKIVSLDGKKEWDLSDEEDLYNYLQEW